MKSTRLERCRLCASRNLESVLDFGPLASCGYFPGKDGADAPVAPLAFLRCRDCGFAQAGHDYEMSDLFRLEYGYRSGLNEMMMTHLSGIVAKIRDRVDLKPGDAVLDIGANDGTLLNAYRDPELTRIAIDPTYEQFSAYYDPGIQGVSDFFAAASYRSLSGGSKARVVTSIAMFYDLADPIAFARDVAAILAEDGLWVLEQSYLPTMLANNSFDTICHEHLAYYCLAQIDRILEAAGMRAVDVSFNAVNGGSFQVFATHAANTAVVESAAVAEVRAREVAEGYATGAPFADFVARVEKQAATLLSLLRSLKAEGKVVHGYGASTKGNTLLQYLGITPEILPVIADRNEVKWGARTPGTNIPIISEAESRDLAPDYYLALPWHFRDGFLRREGAFRARGGKFIFPLPEVEIV